MNEQWEMKRLLQNKYQMSNNTQKKENEVMVG